MRSSTLLQAAALLLVPGASALNIILNNDDSWATANIRSLYTALKDAGHKVLLVAPAANQSGKGGSLNLKSPGKMTTAGEFDLIPAGSPSFGHDPEDENIWYYDGTPSTATLFALDYLVPKVWGKDVKPDLLLSGPNEGHNLSIFAYSGSSTFGAAITAILRGIPGIAVSAADLDHRFCKDVNTTDDISTITAKATVKLLSHIAANAASTGPLLPTGYGLNINLPTLNSSCTDPSFVGTRMSTTKSFGKLVVNETSGASNADFMDLPTADICRTGNCDLPDDVSTTTGKGCKASVSVFNVDSNAISGNTANNVQDMLRPLVTFNSNGSHAAPSNLSSFPVMTASAISVGRHSAGLLAALAVLIGATQLLL